MAAWGADGRRVALAEFASRALQRVNDYPNAYFIPEDPFSLIAWDHASVNMDHGFFEGAIDKIQEHLHVSLPLTEWYEFLSQPYGSVIDALLRAPMAPGA
jgi:hypothetical protein